MGQNGNFGHERRVTVRTIGAISEEDPSEEKLRRDMGRRIAKARVALNLSQMKLARRLGIERSRLSKWERGLHAPLLKQLITLSQALALSLDELIMGRPATAQAPGGLP